MSFAESYLAETAAIANSSTLRASNGLRRSSPRSGKPMVVIYWFGYILCSNRRSVRSSRARRGRSSGSSSDQRGQCWAVTLTFYTTIR